MCIGPVIRAQTFSFFGLQGEEEKKQHNTLG